MTDRDKQIEEMTKDLFSAYAINKLYTEDVAEYLYNAGYRKAENVTREIFEDVEKHLKNLGRTGYVGNMSGILAKLKKKYEILNSWEELTHTCQVEIPHSIESIVDIAFQESEGEG